MTHHQLVEEWKERLNRELFGSVPTDEMGSAQIDEAVLQDFLTRAMLAAAKGAAEAAAVEKAQVDRETHEEDEAFNEAISQSEQQLQDYFKGI